MGDRGNIAVKQYGKDEYVFLYSHWGGYELGSTLKQALASDAGRGRWNDGPYLTRIIFDAMVGDNHGGETGFGISTSLQDNEYTILVVDPEAKQVHACPEQGDGIGVPKQSWSFDEFISLTDVDEMLRQYRR